MPKPTIAIASGAWSKGLAFTKLTEHLTADGYEVTALDNPSVGRRDPDPPATLADDVANFRNAITKLVDDGKDVVVIAHSYGGMVATEGAKDLSKEDRKAAGSEGGIVCLLYLAGIVAPVGGSASSVMKNAPFHYVTFDVGAISQGLNQY
jgi:pimeloyl-ACP methyl ester carboxylesterase